MMDFLIRSSLRYRSAVLGCALLLLGVGLYFGLRMPVDVFPDLSAPTVTVVTEAHGMAPTEVENQITFPIETSVNGAAGVRRVRSTSAVGISVVWVEFDWGTDIYTARQVVSEKLALVSAELPPDVERPILAPISSIMGEILFISISSDRHTDIEVRTTADTVLRRRLLSVAGVSQVTPIGGARKQYQVILDPERLRTYGVTVGEVTHVLARSNENVSAGFMNDRAAEYLVTGVGRIRTLEDIAETVIASREGVPVRVRDVGKARIGEAPKRGTASVNGRSAVVLGIQKQPDANTLALTRELEGVIDSIQERLPEGMKIERSLMRQARFIDVAVSNVFEALLIGALLVVVIVALFLSNVRATFITLTAIPLSLLAAILALKAFGASINTMTLGGLVIAIGSIVDDAIIDVENVFRRLRENAGRREDLRKPILKVVFDASVEIRTSIVFATLIIMLVFVPLFFLSGMEGRLLAPLGLAYVTALFVSLLVAVTVTPVLCSLLLPQAPAVREDREPAWVAGLKAAYGRFLLPMLRHPWAVLLPVLIAFVAAVGAFGFMGLDFLPRFSEGALTITATSLPGTALPQSDTLGGVVEATLLKHPEVESVARRTGRAELDEHAMGVESSEFEVAFTLGDRSREAFLEAVRADLSQVPGVNVDIGQPISHRINHMLSGSRAFIAVKIFGPDLYRLRTLGEEVRTSIEGVPGVVDLALDQQTEVPVLSAKFDRPSMARWGVPIRDAARTLEASLQGLTVSRILEGRNAFDLVVRLGNDDSWDPDSIAEVPLATPSGARVPLKAVARVARVTGPNRISRENVDRKIVVTCNVAGRDVGSVVGDIRAIVDPLLENEKDYYPVYGGRFEAAQQAFPRLLMLWVGVVLGIGLLLHLAFGSVRDAVIIMANLPLALIGGVAGIFVAGGDFSIATGIGLITVFGIATRNGIMLVSHIRHLQAEEDVKDLRTAVLTGAKERLIPILMTALSAGLALIPLALGGGEPGKEIETPMAIVVIFGLLSSMLLNMIVVPVLYLRFGKPVVARDGGGL